VTAGSRARASLAVAGALLLGGCFGTDVELIGREQGIPLCGARLTYRDEDKPNTLQWVVASRAYQDAKRSQLLRFARLKRDVYLAQLQQLRDPETGVPAGTGTYVVGLVRLRDGRLFPDIEPRCGDLDKSVEARARAYGVELDTGGYVPRATGKREALLGWLASLAECAPDERGAEALEAERVVAGGPELAALGVAWQGDLFAEPERKRCEEGSARDCYKLGLRYRNGDQVDRDPQRSFSFFERACKAGNARGCMDVAQCYERGEGVTKDLARARALYRQACDAGEPFACEALKRLGPP
jgi:hypothetical protein